MDFQEPVCRDANAWTVCNGTCVRKGQFLRHDGGCYDAQSAYYVAFVVLGCLAVGTLAIIGTALIALKKKRKIEKEKAEKVDGKDISSPIEVPNEYDMYDQYYQENPPPLSPEQKGAYITSEEYLAMRGKVSPGKKDCALPTSYAQVINDCYVEKEEARPAMERAEPLPYCYYTNGGEAAGKTNYENDLATKVNDLRSPLPPGVYHYYDTK